MWQMLLHMKVCQQMSTKAPFYSLIRLYLVIGPTGKALYHNRQLMLVNNATAMSANGHTYGLHSLPPRLRNVLITATVDCLLYRVSHTLVHRWFWMLSANETLSRIVWMSIR